jgi:nitrous oxidase accessory protein NosD
MTRFTVVLLALTTAAWTAAAEARVLRVPGDAQSIQDAVATAHPGDTIQVGAGRWCGAYITKRLTLLGGPDAVIAGTTSSGASCNGPVLNGTMRVGLWLSEAAASGTTIRHFTFDGAGAGSGSGASAIALGVYGGLVRTGNALVKVNDVRVEHNTFLGTTQGITNWGGDDWVVRHNRLRGFTARGTSGGVGIAVMARTLGGQTLRPAGASVTHNDFEAETPPAKLPSGAWFSGVRFGSADRAEAAHNAFRLTSAGAVPNTSVGVLVTNAVAGGSQGARVTMNDGLESDYVVVVTAGSDAAVVRGNVGRTLVGDEESATTRRGVRRGHQKDEGEGLQ